MIVREPAADEAAALAALLDAHSTELHGESDLSERAGMQVERRSVAREKTL